MFVSRSLGLSLRAVDPVRALIEAINPAGGSVPRVEQNASLALQVAHRAQVLQASCGNGWTATAGRPAHPRCLPGRRTPRRLKPGETLMILPLDPVVIGVHDLARARSAEASLS